MAKGYVSGLRTSEITARKYCHDMIKKGAPQPTTSADRRSECSSESPQPVVHARPAYVLYVYLYPKAWKSNGCAPESENSTSDAFSCETSEIDRTIPTYCEARAHFLVRQKRNLTDLLHIAGRSCIALIYSS